jgi:hypothetical protein
MDTLRQLANVQSALDWSAEYVRKREPILAALEHASGSIFAGGVTNVQE